MDTAFHMSLVHHTPEKGVALAALVHGLAQAAVDGAPDSLDARWSLIEARIYKAKLLEKLAASARRLAFKKAKPEFADHAGRWREFVKAAHDLAQAGADSDRAVEGILRAIEFQLQSCHYVGADRAAAVEGIAKLETLLKQNPHKNDAALAAARGTVLLARAELLLAAEPPRPDEAAERIRAGLALLGPMLKAANPSFPLIRRYNDLVTLAKRNAAIEIEASYHMVDCPVTQKGLHLALPLSRGWRYLEWTSHATKVRRLELFRVNTSDDELARVWLTAYEHGSKYPLFGGGQKVDGKKPKKLAGMIYEKNKGYGSYKLAKKKRRRRPKKVRLSSSVRSAYYYEVLSSGPTFRPWYHRLRGWVFAGKVRSYGIRINDRQNDGEDGEHPELTALLQAVRGD